MCFLYLCKVKDFGWNHRVVYRIDRELELTMRIKPKKRIVREKPEPLALPDKADESWSLGNPPEKGRRRKVEFSHNA